MQVICFFLQIHILEHIGNKFDGDKTEEEFLNKNFYLKDVLTYVNYIGFAL